MKNRKVITICASAAHYTYLFEIQKQLRKLGYKVLIPTSAYKMKRMNNFDVTFHKTWYNDHKDYKKKSKLMNDHFKKVLAADAILVANFEKNGMPGYIGGNVLMEMTLAYHYKKYLFVYNEISEKLGIKEEIYGMQPHFINNDLTKI